MQNLSPIQRLYLVFSVSGAIGTWFFNLQIEDLSGFFFDAWATPLNCSLSMDLTVVVLAFLTFMLAEHRRWVFSPLTIGVLMVLAVVIAVAFTLPLFLFLRERAPAR